MTEEEKRNIFNESNAKPQKTKFDMSKLLLFGGSALGTVTLFAAVGIPIALTYKDKEKDSSFTVNNIEELTEWKSKEENFSLIVNSVASKSVEQLEVIVLETSQSLQPINISKEGIEEFNDKLGVELRIANIPSNISFEYLLEKGQVNKTGERYTLSIIIKAKTIEEFSVNEKALIKAIDQDQIDVEEAIALIEKDNHEFIEGTEVNSLKILEAFTSALTPPLGVTYSATLSLVANEATITASKGNPVKSASKVVTFSFKREDTVVMKERIEALLIDGKIVQSIVEGNTYLPSHVNDALLNSSLPININGSDLGVTFNFTKATNNPDNDTLGELSVVCQISKEGQNTQEVNMILTGLMTTQMLNDYFEMTINKFKTYFNTTFVINANGHLEGTVVSSLLNPRYLFDETICQEEEFNNIFGEASLGLWPTLPSYVNIIGDSEMSVVKFWLSYRGTKHLSKQFIIEVNNRDAIRNAFKIVIDPSWTGSSNSLNFVTNVSLLPNAFASMYVTKEMLASVLGSQIGNLPQYGYTNVSCEWDGIGVLKIYFGNKVIGNDVLIINVTKQ